MSLLYNKSLNDQLDANGTEDVTNQGAAHWYQGVGNELARGASNIGTFYERGVQQSDDTAATALGVNQYVRRDGSVGKIREIDSTPPAELAKYDQEPDYLGPADYGRSLRESYAAEKRAAERLGLRPS